ncbi:TEA-domain-containing protein, partial [Patellaria atrata CBS 101060]
RQEESNTKDGDKKWPWPLELAFFRALVRWPPVGKTKVIIHGKQRGRNEMIAEYIRETTGYIRDRKQVSSHIQVLRPYFK